MCYALNVHDLLQLFMSTMNIIMKIPVLVFVIIFLATVWLHFSCVRNGNSFQNSQIAHKHSRYNSHTSQYSKQLLSVLQKSKSSDRVHSNFVYSVVNTGDSHVCLPWTFIPIPRNIKIAQNSLDMRKPFSGTLLLGILHGVLRYEDDHKIEISIFLWMSHSHGLSYSLVRSYRNTLYNLLYASKRNRKLIHELRATIIASGRQQSKNSQICNLKGNQQKLSQDMLLLGGEFFFRTNEQCNISALSSQTEQRYSFCPIRAKNWARRIANKSTRIKRIKTFLSRAKRIYWISTSGSKLKCISMKNRLIHTNPFLSGHLFETNTKNRVITKIYYPYSFSSFYFEQAGTSYEKFKLMNNKYTKVSGGFIACSTITELGAVSSSAIQVNKTTIWYNSQFVCDSQLNKLLKKKINKKQYKSFSFTIGCSPSNLK